MDNGISEISEVEAEYLQTIIEKVTDRHMTVTEIKEFGTMKQLLNEFDDETAAVIAFQFTLLKVFILGDDCDV